MYHRAGLILVRKDETIISDPGKGDQLPPHVANELINSPSYAVCKKRSVRHGSYYVCSASWVDFAAYDICAHTIAVAETDGLLADFIRCYKATNQGPPNSRCLGTHEPSCWAWDKTHEVHPKKERSCKFKQKAKGCGGKLRHHVISAHHATSFHFRTSALRSRGCRNKWDDICS